jgi:hypothetical protein
MTLVEDARRLAETRVVDHRSMPRIVAALEAFERIVPTFLRGAFLDDAGRPTVWVCEICGGPGGSQESVEHSRTCRVGALVAALGGMA